MYTERTELYNISCASHTLPPLVPLFPFFTFFSFSLCRRRRRRRRLFLFAAFENVSRRPINHQFERLYESAQKIFSSRLLKRTNQ